MPTLLTLPDWHCLVAAFRGERGVLPGDCLVLRRAHQLAHLHRVRYVPGAADRVDRRRVEIVALINNWVISYVCPCPDTAARVGRAVDELARAYVDAEYALASADSGSAESVHHAWSEASGLTVGWTDLVAEVVDGQPPIPWHPERPTR